MPTQPMIQKVPQTQPRILRSAGEFADVKPGRPEIDQRIRKILVGKYRRFAVSAGLQCSFFVRERE